MSRYINANAFDERVRIAVGFAEEELTDDFKDGVSCTLELLKTQPTADVVEVVRCEDCVYWEQATDNSGNCNRAFERTAYDTDFCSYGERREDED